MTITQFRDHEYADDNRLLYELINGQLVGRTAYQPRHQAVLVKLMCIVCAYTGINEAGEVLPGPIDLILDDTNVVQPDPIYIAAEKAHLVTDNGVEGVPTMVVEVSSPSSIYRDRVTKKALYEQFGISEYWLVDPADNYIEIFSLADGQYKLHSAAS